MWYRMDRTKHRYLDNQVEKWMQIWTWMQHRMLILYRWSGRVMVGILLAVSLWFVEYMLLRCKSYYYVFMIFNIYYIRFI